MIRRLVEFSVDARGWVTGITLLLAGAALVVGLQLRLDALPDLTNNQVIVLTPSPGLTPEEVERLITRPIEVALGGVADLVEQRSLSLSGISSVTVIFEKSVSPWLARQMIAERLTSLELPTAAKPELAPLTGGLGEIFHLTLSSPSRTPAELLELATYRVAPLLKSVSGVVEVNSWGGAQRTWDVIADDARLSARGLTLSQLKTALEGATGVSTGGALPSGPTQVLLRGQARPATPGELGAAFVSGNSVRVGDVAEVREGARLRLGAATANGQGETLYLMAQMLRDANALEVMDRLHARMPEVRKVLPDDVRIDVVYDRSTLVKATLKTVALNLLEGGLLVVIVLLLFLGSVRAGLIVASVIPLSMAFATAAMALLDIPGNLMSLGALDFGLLVDGAVVLVEGLFHGLSRQEGTLAPTELRARIRAISAKSARPVFFSVLVILLVYVPVLSLTGVDGTLFRPMALTVVFALGAALVLSLTWVPAVASLVLRQKDVPHRPPPLVRFVDWAYPKILAPGLKRRPAVVAGAVAMLVVGVMLGRTLGVEFTPQLDEGDLIIQTVRAPDISLEEAVKAATRTEARVRGAFPEVAQIVSRIGSPAVATDLMSIDLADVFVKLHPPEMWRPGMTKTRLTEELEALLRREEPEMEASFTQPIQMRFNELLGGAVTDVAVSIYGDDLGALRRTADAVAVRIEQVPGAADVRVLAPPFVPLITVRPRALDAATAGFSSRDVLDAIQAARVGLDVGLTFDGPVPIPLRLKTAGATDAWSLDSLPLPVAAGGVVPLSRVADVIRTEGPALISRRNGERRLVVGFNVRGADLGSAVAGAQAAVDGVKRPSGFRLEWGGQYESLTEASRRLALVVPVVLLGILALLAFTFSRLRPALFVFSLVPFAGIGGAASLWARSMPVSLPAAIGFIALSGIAVMNGVVWVSRALELVDEGMPADAASERAARERARPVLMTALVAAFGFLPMMIATGVGAEVQRPLATVVVGGLASSTLLTLLVLPALFPVVVGARRRRGEA
ncbi:MAG: CusA/CzcA family heavy metal efflux RND transporter [Myxococcales bacterium]|nr:CusA/CzcA family heavy metal efflux RND transporter [Myxococcales bacterium]